MQKISMRNDEIFIYEYLNEDLLTHWLVIITDILIVVLNRFVFTGKSEVHCCVATINALVDILDCPDS